MSISGIGLNYYHNNVATVRNTKNVNSTGKNDGFAGKVTEKNPVSPEDMTLEEYKAYFNEKMNSLYTHPSQRNRNDIIDITDAAYKRMQTDPEYEKKILDALAKNKAVNFGNYIPQISYMHIDDTYEKCYGYTQGMKENVVMDVGSVYGSYYETAKSYMGLRKEEKQAGFAEKVTDKSQVSSEDMTLEEYKEYFNEKMSGLYTHPSQRDMNWVIDITDAAYKRMQSDPEYEKKILDALAKNKAVDFGGNIPVVAYTHIDDTYEKCYGYTQGMKENDGYSGSSSAKGTDAGRQKKARQKELLEEYLEKRAQMKEFQQEALEEKIAKQELERSRLTKVWSSKRQMAAATNAYESNVMTETSTGSNSLLG